MVKINIYYQDLNQDAQDEVWQKVQNELISSGEVEYRNEDETEDEFQNRLNEEIDYYINCHNFVNEFMI